jgi:hypothetical protein
MKVCVSPGCQRGEGFGITVAYGLMTDGRDYVTGNLTLPTHPRHTERLDGSSHEKPAMTKVPSASFSPELLTLMRSALDTAVHQIDRSNRTLATKAKMAQRIVRTASEGVTDLYVLMSAAVDEGRVPAA